jgi:hypothetical protein
MPRKKSKQALLAWPLFGMPADVQLRPHFASGGVEFRSEEAGLRGEALGNFPQAFAHLSPISGAVNLDRVLDGGGPPTRK